MSNYLVLFDSVKEVLDLNASLSFVRLVFDKRMLKELFSIRSLVVVLHQNRLYKVLELRTPPLRLESRRRVSRNQEQGSHGMHVAQRRLSFGHFKGGNSQAPQVGSVVIGGIRIFIAGNHLRGHPIRRSDERISPADGSIQLGADTKIHQFDFGIVGQKDVLAFNISMDDFASM